MPQRYGWRPHHRHAATVHTCEATFAQTFNWESFGILSLGTNSQGSRCVDVTGGTADGTPIQLFGCNGTSAQQWLSWSRDQKHTERQMPRRLRQFSRPAGEAQNLQWQPWAALGDPVALAVPVLSIARSPPSCWKAEDRKVKLSLPALRTIDRRTSFLPIVSCP
jgi:hypothetical protein